MKTLTVVIDEDSNECLYIDGNSWESKGEKTVHSCDVAEAAGDQPILFRHVSIDFYHHDWPDTLEEALTKPDSVPRLRPD